METREQRGSEEVDWRPRKRRRHALLHFLRRHPPRPRIEAYHGYGTTEVLFLKGRVLRDAGVGEVRAEDRALRNLKNTVRRALTDEIPHARVRARLGSETSEARADREGFFDIQLRTAATFAPGELWHEVELEVVEPVRAGEEPARAVARVLVPPPDAEFGVISDIDDTVVRTEVTHWLRMLRIVLLTNAHSRMPFDHVDSLYRALQGGSTGARYNPIFYVSSSPWNFYDLLEEFFRVHRIPEGPLFLRDWNYSPRKLLGMGHQEHKLVLIRALFDTYPELPFVLIGDSGQEDPEIYRAVVREYPARVAAIYIRNVTSEAREREVQGIAAEVAAMGSPMLLVQEKTEAAAHAAANGLIAAAALDRMRAADAMPEPEPTLLEKVVNPDARGA